MKYGKERPPGYRDPSLAHRDNYGLSPQSLIDYLEARGRVVPPELRRLAAGSSRHLHIWVASGPLSYECACCGEVRSIDGRAA